MIRFEILNKEKILQELPQLMELIRGWEYSEWKEENFLYELPRKWEFSFLVMDEGAINGFCIASNKIQSAYYIHLFFVRPNYRKKGIGEQMLQQAMNLGKQQGLQSLELRCPESNTKALAFYHRNGITTKKIIQDETSGKEKDHYLVYKLN